MKLGCHFYVVSSSVYFVVLIFVVKLSLDKLLNKTLSQQFKTSENECCGCANVAEECYSMQNRGTITIWEISIYVRSHYITKSTLKVFVWLLLDRYYCYGDLYPCMIVVSNIICIRIVLINWTMIYLSAKRLFALKLTCEEKREIFCMLIVLVIS